MEETKEIKEEVKEEKPLKKREPETIGEMIGITIADEELPE